MKFKLTFELVPTTTWNVSIYQILNNSGNKALWYDIKKKLIEKEGDYCFICKSTQKPLEAHEFWEYDDKNFIQILVGIHHLCSMCHKIKHFGLWTRTQYGDENLKRLKLTEDDLREHFCKTNNCSLQDLKKYEKEAFDEYKKRSKQEWKQDLKEYSFINNFR